MHEVLDEHMLEAIQSKNQDLAQHNRSHFNEIGAVAINFMSAPGAGKTTLLEAMITHLTRKHKVAAIEGDMVGELDAQRLREKGVEVFQISTGRSCHLDAQMVAKLLHAHSFDHMDYLLIENVGNLVCPAEFPLGEHKRVVLLSVTEGDDKPLKYPIIFHQCNAVIFTKCDLLPFVNFNLERAKDYIAGLNPTALSFAVSAKSGQGLEDWFTWLDEQRLPTNHVHKDRAHQENAAQVPISAG